MRYGFALAALLLPLGGCVVPPQPAPYGYGGYPQPQPGYASDYAYPGYAYNSGSPTLYVGGVTWPLIFYGGSWGYWDGSHRWHGAPDGVRRQLEVRHPGGVGYRPYGGGQFGRPEGPRFGGRPGEGFGGGNCPAGFAPGGRPGGFRPGGPPGGIRPAAGPRPGPANHPSGERHRQDDHR